jgi:hypothetical protein
MPRKHPPAPPYGAIGAGLPFRGRHGPKLAIAITLGLLVASLVAAWAGHEHPTPAPLVFFLASFLVVSFALTVRQLGPRWAVAWIVQTALVAVLAVTVAATPDVQPRASLAPARAITISAGVGRWLDEHLGGKPKAKQPAHAPSTTTRRPR